MNYKNKKYLSESTWLIQRLNKLDFFLLAQLRSCNSKERIDIQKKLQKVDLKIKFISFKNFKSMQFFLALKSNTINSLLKGRLVLIYSETQIKWFTPLMDLIRITKVLRPFVIYSNGRFININSDISIKEMESFHLLQWNNFLNQFNGSNVSNIFDIFKNSYSELLQFQYKVLLNALTHKSQNEDKV